MGGRILSYKGVCGAWMALKDFSSFGDVEQFSVGEDYGLSAGCGQYFQEQIVSDFFQDVAGGVLRDFVWPAELGAAKDGLTEHKV